MNENPQNLPVPTAPLSKIDTRADDEGRAIKVANGYRLARPKTTRKSRKKYGQPLKQPKKKKGNQRILMLDRPDYGYEIPDFLKAIINVEVQRTNDRYRL